jgi:hypothetical protein
MAIMTMLQLVVMMEVVVVIMISGKREIKELQETAILGAAHTVREVPV